MKMVVNPRIASHFLVSLMFLKSDIQASKKMLAGPEMPKSCFSWDDAMLSAAAVVNPDMTGNEKNWTRKPEKFNLRDTNQFFEENSNANGVCIRRDLFFLTTAYLSLLGSLKVVKCSQLFNFCAIPRHIDGYLVNCLMADSRDFV